MTTKEAFKHMTNQRGWYKLCGINPIAARSIKMRYESGGVTDDKIRELLLSANYALKPEVWKAPKVKKSDT